MTQVKEGDVIVLRHAYEKCLFIPPTLKTVPGGRAATNLAAGSYRPFYALARVTRRPTHDMVGSREPGQYGR